ncbi:hypothetical protein B0H14DRAFT_3539431 [Mycena olivaceomarginata]|nr:hypothetical protein B0H14DRAFT_3539431 [Mycena olivaceomarginata]
MGAGQRWRWVRVAASVWHGNDPREGWDAAHRLCVAWAKGRDGWWLEIIAVDGPGQMNYGGERVPDVRCGWNDDDH